MQLENERLHVEVADPGSLYRRMRFDWTGMVTQVTLDGRHTFCTVELPAGAEGPNSEGVGLSNDFGLVKPLGWDEAKVGETFPKLAVGSLTKTIDGRYDHMRDYPLEPTEKRVWWEDGTLCFAIEPLPCRGYAAALEKRLYLQDTSLFVKSTLRNVGERAIHTTEYNHNFLAVDGRPIDSGVTVDFPAPLEDAAGSFPMLRFEGRRLSFVGVPSVFWFSIPQVPHEPGVRFTLRDSRAGVGVRESGDFPLMQINVWGKEHTVCPEAFVALDVEPGETYTWTRRWVFFTLS